MFSFLILRLYFLKFLNFWIILIGISVSKVNSGFIVIVDGIVVFVLRIILVILSVIFFLISFVFIYFIMKFNLKKWLWRDWSNDNVFLLIDWLMWFVVWIIFEEYFIVCEEEGSFWKCVYCLYFYYGLVLIFKFLLII